MTINWIEYEGTLPVSRGHGVQFHDTSIPDRSESLVAFLVGFAWMHGRSDEATVYCIKPNDITTADVLKAMRARVDEMISNRVIPHHQITDRISAWVNG